MLLPVPLLRDVRPRSRRISLHLAIDLDWLLLGRCPKLGNKILAESKASAMISVEVRLLSLAELMREYRIDELALMLSGLTHACEKFSTSDQLNQPLATDERIHHLGALLEGLMICSSNFDADGSLLSQISNFRQEILAKKVDRRECVIARRLTDILEAIKYNLGQRMFLYVPPDQAPYWNNVFWFGDAFLVVFPHTAKVELAELGACRVAGRWTACVFHSMRLAEYGLRKLAKSMSVTLIDKRKRVPIEYGEWQKIIDAINSKIAKSRLLASGPEKERQLKFYSDAAERCGYLKDIFRNEAAHVRRTYEKEEAIGIIERVKGFMEVLAKHYAEKELKRIRKRQPSNAETHESSPQ
jgi:hypothetical protein